MLYIPCSTVWAADRDDAGSDDDGDGDRYRQPLGVRGSAPRALITISMNSADDNLETNRAERDECYRGVRSPVRA